MAQICTFKRKSPSDPRQAPRVTFLHAHLKGALLRFLGCSGLYMKSVNHIYIPHISICLYRVCHRSPMLRQCPLIAQPRCYLLILNIKIIKEVVWSLPWNDEIDNQWEPSWAPFWTLIGLSDSSKSRNPKMSQSGPHWRPVCSWPGPAKGAQNLGKHKVSAICESPPAPPLCPRDRPHWAPKNGPPGFAFICVRVILLWKPFGRNIKQL